MAEACGQRVALGALDGGEDLLRVLQEALTRGRELDAAPRAVEQHDAEFLPEQRDLPREQRLRNVQTLRGSAEVKRLGIALHKCLIPHFRFRVQNGTHYKSAQ
jgi:hypothetical protein